MNSFRVVFNDYFEGVYPMLPDESYFSPLSRPFDLVRVTERAEAGG